MKTTANLFLNATVYLVYIKTPIEFFYDVNDFWFVKNCRLEYTICKGEIIVAISLKSKHEFLGKKLELAPAVAMPL